MKTDNQEHVGRHVFEIAGLGLAPFRFVGLSENALRFPDGSSKAGGSCDYCGAGIRWECHIRSADGRRSKIGCDCVRKCGDAGLLQAYKSSPEFRAHQRQLREAKNAMVFGALKALIAVHADQLRAMPHPHNFVDRQSGNPLNRLDYVNWMFDHCGASGRAAMLKGLKKLLNVPA